jgi:hypothetical protein
VDGGSSVAVLTYLRRILDSLDHPDMIHLILHYLLALPELSAKKSAGSRASISAARKRKSLDLATMMAMTAEDKPTPSLFNLVDLILGSLRSQNQQTIAVTLQLLSVILRRHHRYAVTTLLRTAVIINDEPQKTVGAHEREMEFLLSLAGEIGGNDGLDEAYENHVKDSLSLLESHPCSVPIIAPKSAPGTAKAAGGHAPVPGGPRDVHPHTLRPDDPILRALVDSFEAFFINPVETNLSLTETVINLAGCGLMHIDGWLLPDQSKYTFETIEQDEVDESDDSDDAKEKRQLLALQNARRSPQWSEVQLPALLSVLQKLVNQVQTYRTEIPRFDDLLSQRQSLFNASTSQPPSVPTTPVPPRSSHSRRHGSRTSIESTSTSRSNSPHRPSTLDSLAQRIFPDLASSRNSSPRGRKNSSQSSTYSPTPAQSRLQNSSSLSTPPLQFPMGSEATSRGSSRHYSASPMRDDNIPASQIAAFAAIDRSILQRKVGIPSQTGELSPVPFPNLRKSSEPLLEEGSTAASSVGGEEESTVQLVSVSHVLTNVIVLREFLLELAALVQVRAGLFGEVRFV